VIITVSAIILYNNIIVILMDNSNTHTEQQIRQYSHNIESFCRQIDLVSRQLITNTNIQDFAVYEEMTERERILISQEVIRSFARTVKNYEFITSVIYYGNDGLFLKADAKENLAKFDSNNTGAWLYTSDIFREINYNQSKLTVFGGFSNDDFTTSGEFPVSGHDPGYCISAARNVFAGSASGVLIINIDLEHFISIYSGTASDKTGVMYITDNRGKIISHIDAAEIGGLSQAFTLADSYSDIEISTLGISGEMTQVVANRLEHDLVLISEVPVSVIMRDVSRLRNILLITLVIAFAAAAVTGTYFVGRIIRPVEKLTDAMKKVEMGDLGMTLDSKPGNELGVLITQFNEMSQSIQGLMIKNEAIHEEKRKIEMEALQAQINPHFLYNTINIIKWMAVAIKAENISDCLTALGDLLNPIFKSRDILCTVGEEVTYTKQYIKIMNYRFAGFYDVNISVPEELMDCMTLRFILQPLVENAIQHGDMDSGNGHIDITVDELGDSIKLTVTDNGKGLEAEKIKEINQSLESGIDTGEQSESRIGLTNVSRRIKLHFGDEYGLTARSRKGEGTSVSVTIPKVPKPQ